MSELLRNLYDSEDEDEEFSDESYSEEEEEYDDEVIEEEEEEKIDLMALANQKKPVNKPIKITTKKNDQKRETLTMTEEESIHYQKLKRYGINGVVEEEQGSDFSESVRFSLDVLQSSKMFYDNVSPILFQIMNCNKDFVSERTRLLRKGRDEQSTKLDAYILTHTTVSPYTMETCPTSEFNQVLDLQDHMCCISYDRRFLFVYGGRNEKGLLNELIRYDLQTGKACMIRNLDYLSLVNYRNETVLHLPSISNSGMVFCGSTIYLFGTSRRFGDSRYYESVIVHQNYNQAYDDFKKGELEVFAIGDVNCLDKIGFGVGITLPASLTGRVHPFLKPGSRTVTVRSHFSITQIEKASNLVEAYMFGGLKNNTPTDEMFCYVFDGSPLFEVIKIDKPTKEELAENNLITWPSPRFSHSTCVVSHLIFLFGGIGVGNKLLNDLLMFDTNTNKWVEIVCDSLLPPPMYKHQMFSINNQSFYCYGGCTELKEGSETNSLYRFDIVDRKWYLIEIISEESNSIKSLPFAGQCVVANNSLYRVGGITRKGYSCVKLCNLNDPGKPIPLCSYLQKKRCEGFLCDVVFRLKDSNPSTFSYILAHKAIIKVRCSCLYQKIYESSETMSTNQFSGLFINDNEITLVDVLECNTIVFTAYLDFLYTGEVNLNGLENVEAFEGLVGKFSPSRHYPFIKTICSKREKKDLELSKKILANIHNDFSLLIDDSSHSDLTIVLGSEPELLEIPDIDNITESDNDNLDSVPEGGIAVHRLIMSRSPFFARMFVTSGMKESRERVAYLSDYSSEVMYEVLKYLYTDSITLTSSNCLGVLVYCIMLDLVDMASCCRRMVVSLLDNSIVWSVFEIANIYNDKALESECEHFILDHYDELCTCDGFLNMPELTRIKIKQLNEKKRKKK